MKNTDLQKLGLQEISKAKQAKTNGGAYYPQGYTSSFIRRSYKTYLV